MRMVMMRSTFSTLRCLERPEFWNLSSRVWRMTSPTEPISGCTDAGCSYLGLWHCGSCPRASGWNIRTSSRSTGKVYSGTTKWPFYGTTRSISVRLSSSSGWWCYCVTLNDALVFSTSGDYSRNVEIVTSYRKSTCNLVKCCRNNLTPLLFQMAGLMTLTWADDGASSKASWPTWSNLVEGGSRDGRPFRHPRADRRRQTFRRAQDHHWTHHQRCVDFDANLMTFQDANDLFA